MAGSRLNIQSKSDVGSYTYGTRPAASAQSVVHYVGGAEIRYAATAGNGAGAMQEVAG